MSVEFNATFETSEELEASFTDVVMAPPTLQTKNVTIIQNGQSSVEADEGYDGLQKVNITVAETFQTKVVTITQNGETEVSADSGYNGLEKVNITVNLPKYEGGVE